MTEIPWVHTSRHELDGLSVPGAMSLVDGPRTPALELLDKLGQVFDEVPVSISELALSEQPMPRAPELATRIGDARLLYDLEVLCWRPGVQLDLIRFLRDLCRTKGVVALWPGTISGQRATFSRPGRADHVDADIRGFSVIRPVPTQFPDEVPFTIERIPS